MHSDDIGGYPFDGPGLNCSHAYLLPAVRDLLREEEQRLEPGRRRLFEVGCGNGSVAHVLSEHGWDVIGIDPSEQGIGLARAAYPGLRVYQRSAYDELEKEFGTFPVVLSLEVVEHVYFPRKFAAALFSLVEPGGVAIVSTPYHGYWKNLALALSGKMDAHFTALWDHGHIKFWSMRTLGTLLREGGFSVAQFKRVGRVPVLAKSMIALARKPPEGPYP